VIWVTPLVPGQPASVHVQASVAGWLDLWIDANVNGAFDAVELLFSGPVPPGPGVLGFVVPGPSPAGPTFARVRYNTGGPLPPVGPAPDGEVEDYEVRIERLDFGDAPDPTYRTLFANGGAQVSVRLKDGRVFSELLVSDATALAAMRGFKDLPFAVDDIETIFQTADDRNPQVRGGWDFWDDWKG